MTLKAYKDLFWVDANNLRYRNSVQETTNIDIYLHGFLEWFYYRLLNVE